MKKKKILWFSKTRSVKAQKRAQFRERSIETAIKKLSFVPFSWAISGNKTMNYTNTKI